MSAYDILTGIQLCMAMAMIAYGIYFRKSRMCRLWWFAGPCVLVAIWAAAVLYYYTEYPFLTTLCFLMAFFLGLGLGLWFKKGLPELTYCRKQHRLRCPPLRTALPVNLFFCLIFRLVPGRGLPHALHHSFVAVQRGTGLCAGHRHGLAVGTGIGHAVRYSHAGTAGL